MNLDPVQLEKDINNIPGICDEGKVAIKRLFTNNFGVNFIPKYEIKIGAIYVPKGYFRPCILVALNNIKALISLGKDSYQIGMVNHSFDSTEYTAEKLIKSGLYVKVANNAEEYFASCK